MLAVLVQPGRSAAVGHGAGVAGHPGRAGRADSRRQVRAGTAGHAQPGGALQERLLGEPVHILHFVGHGVFDESSQAGSLALEDARGRPHLVQGEQLATLLRNHPAMRLAYLNACEGALASGQSVFTGVAQTLVQEGVPAAVAMQAEISDTGAIELARTFYTALAGGRPVDAALTQARVALSVAGSRNGPSLCSSAVRPTIACSTSARCCPRPTAPTPA